MELRKVPIVTTDMLIRKPPAEVFEAFVNPAITTKFWFTRSSGRLEADTRVRWDWEMYGLSVDVRVKAVEPPRRIEIEWGQAGRPFTTVEWTFTHRPDNTTLVSVTNSRFPGDGDDVVRQALDSMGGFTIVLCGAKAFLEHNLQLNLIADRFPAGH